jgi:GT2 family glycosyltransferase
LPPSPQTRHTVTAVIVAHDGASMLPGLVQALRGQTHAVGRIVAVDTGSRDRSGAVLAELIGQDAVFGMDRATGFGQAVWGALRRAPALRPETSGQPQVEWVWLLHDDCEPAPETLERLLKAASRDRTVVVLGPKVLDGTDRRVLREVGISLDRSGRRITGIDLGEYDQGQHDHNRAVMAVSSAGMLIRRDVWERIGGFDTHLRLFRDDVDFCWRVHAAGYRVHVVTDAILYHRELTARRGRVPEGTTARRLDRRNALYVLAVNLPLLAMLWTMAGCVAGALLRAAYFLLTKQLGQAGDQVHAVGDLLAHPLRLWKARRRRAAGRRKGYDAVRMFIAHSRPVRQLTENILSLLSPQGTGGAHHAGSIGGDDQDEQFIDPPSVPRRIMASTGVQLFAVLLVVSLVAERRLLGASPLGGGALVPAWGGASALWAEYLAGFHAVGVGSAASAPPYLAVVAALATVLGGQAWLATDILLLGCVPLAGLSAYLCSRKLASSRLARAWLSAAYALLPVASGAIAAGRLGTATAFIIVPVIARTAAATLTAPPRRARSAAWATGLLVALAAAFVPLVWAVAAGLALVVLVVGRWGWPLLSGKLPLVRPSAGGSQPAGRPFSVVNAAIVVLTPLAVLFPWSLHLLASPSAFLLEAGVQPSGLASASLRPGALLLLSPGGPGLPPAWVTVGFGLAVVSALLGRRTALVASGWAVAVAGFAAGIAVSRSTVTSVDGGSTSAWPGTALVIAALGLLIAAAPAAEWLASGLVGDNGTGITPDGTIAGRRAGVPPRPVAILALVAVASAPLLAGWFWMAGGVRGPVTTVSSPVLPAFVAASSAGGLQYRTLVLRQDNGALTFSVIRQADPALGEPELTGYAPADQALARQVAALGAPDGSDAGDPGLVLGEFDIRWVLVPSPVSAALVQRLNAAVGLVPLSSAPTYDLWQVTGPVSRVRVLGPSGTVTTLPSQAVGATQVSAPASGGTLVLAEPHGGWTAALNGHALTSLATPVDGWAQGFTLPPGGGQLTISRNNTARDISLIVEVIAFLAVCLLALPGKRMAVAEVDTVAEVDASGASGAAQAQEDRGTERVPGRRATRGRASRGTPAGGLRRRSAPGRATGSHAVPTGSRAAATPADDAPATESLQAAEMAALATSGTGGLAAQAGSLPAGGVAPWDADDGWPQSHDWSQPTAPGGSGTGPSSVIGTGGSTGTGPTPVIGTGGTGPSPARWDTSGTDTSGPTGWDTPSPARRDTPSPTGWDTPSPARRDTPSPDAWASGTPEAGPDAWIPADATAPATAGDASDGTENTADTLWAGIMAERDSGAWPNMRADQPARDTPAPDTGPRAQAPDTGPRAQADRPDSSTLDSGRSALDSGSGPGRDTQAGWTAGGSTGPSPSWGTGAGADTEASWASGSGTRPTATWNPGSSADTDTDGDGDGDVGRDGEPVSSPAEAPKPGERRARHAGKHGRPARRPWDRSGKDGEQ